MQTHKERIMKAAACFLIMSLLISLLANVASMRIHDEASSIASGLSRRVKGFLMRNSADWTSGKTVSTDTNLMKAQEESKKGVFPKKPCLTYELCRKKKVICYKKCSKGQGEVNTQHIPKCFVKCKKCIPTCP